MVARGRLRFLTCGSVDDGKSTLIGRLLYETGSVKDDEIAFVERESKKQGFASGLDLSLLVDGLEAEREQRITIDVAYRYFASKERAFIVADTPGHEQYTRNMATGASVSDAAVILVDARKGVLPQTWRHAHIASLLGIRHVVLAVNKIDLVGFSGEKFHHVVGDFLGGVEKLGFVQTTAVPISASEGDNVTSRSPRLPWYDGPSLLEVLDQIEVGVHEPAAPFRFPVQWVNRPDADFRGLSGTVASGIVRRGDRVVVAASGAASKVARIVTADRDLEEARAGDAVTLVLADALDIGRGDLLAHGDTLPKVERQFAADVLWMSEGPMLPGRDYSMRIGNTFVPARVTRLVHRIDVNTRDPIAASELTLNEIGLCHLTTSAPVAFDSYRQNRRTGAFILVDRLTHRTVGAGMIKGGLHHAENVRPQDLLVDKSARAELSGHRPAVLWFTGLSASGKSTIANLVERELHARGVRTYLLDGDNLRLGLNADLGFSSADRVENIRRVGEVAKLFVDAGLVVLCSFISPFRAERQRAREIVEEREFIEVFVDTSLAECIRRDPKGLYRLAQEGRIENFTGLDSPYEPPEAPEIVISTDEVGAEVAAERIVRELIARGIIR